jgi:hypothetical protein
MKITGDGLLVFKRLQLNASTRDGMEIVKVGGLHGIRVDQSRVLYQYRADRSDCSATWAAELFMGIARSFTF